MLSLRYCSRKKKRQIQLGDAGTIDRFGLALVIKKNGQKE